MTISQPSNLGIPKQLRKIITEIIILSLPKQFIDLNTSLISCLYIRQRKESKEEKNIFFPIWLPFIISLNSLIVVFVFYSYIPALVSVSSLLNFDNPFISSWIVISCSNLSLIHLFDFSISTNIQIYTGYYLLLFSWLKL